MSSSSTQERREGEKEGERERALLSDERQDLSILPLPPKTAKANFHIHDMYSTVQHSTEHQIPKGKERDKGKQKGDSVAQTHNPYYSVPCAVMRVIYRCCRVMGYARTSCLFQYVRKGKCKSYTR